MYPRPIFIYRPTEVVKTCMVTCIHFQKGKKVIHCVKHLNDKVITIFLS